MTISTRPFFRTGGWGSPKIDIKDPNLKLYLPLWRPDMAGSPMKSKDLYSNSCTVTGATWGYQGRALDGSDDQISCGDLGNALDAVATFSIGGWAKQTTLDENRGLFSKQLDPNHRLEFTTYNDGNMYILIAANAVAVNAYFDYSTAVTAGKFFHWFIVYNGGGATDADKMKLFIDNTSISLTYSAAMPSVTGDMGASAFVIGKYQSENAYWKGTIGEVMVYSRALSVGERTKIYQATKWRYT